MKNSHGQVLVIFVIMLPLLILFSAYVIDTSYVTYHKNKLDNINDLISDYAVKHDNVKEEDVGKLLRQNDSDAVIKKIELGDNVNIVIEKDISAIFGRLIDKNSYKINSSVNKKRNVVSENENNDVEDKMGDSDEENKES